LHRVGLLILLVKTSVGPMRSKGRCLVDLGCITVIYAVPLLSAAASSMRCGECWSKKIVIIFTTRAKKGLR
jgi:hypothetical protein